MTIILRNPQKTDVITRMMIHYPIKICEVKMNVILSQKNTYVTKKIHTKTKKIVMKSRQEAKKIHMTMFIIMHIAIIANQTKSRVNTTETKDRMIMKTKRTIAESPTTITTQKVVTIPKLMKTGSNNFNEEDDSTEHDGDGNTQDNDNYEDGSDSHGY